MLSKLSATQENYFFLPPKTFLLFSLTIFLSTSITYNGGDENAKRVENGKISVFYDFLEPLLDW